MELRCDYVPAIVLSRSIEKGVAAQLPRKFQVERREENSETPEPSIMVVGMLRTDDGAC